MEWREAFVVGRRQYDDRQGYQPILRGRDPDTKEDSTGNIARCLLIPAHPRVDSLCGALCDACADGACLDVALHAV